MRNTTFKIKDILYKWARLTQEYKNNTIEFQMNIYMILKEEIDNGCHVYLNDILIFDKT